MRKTTINFAHKNWAKTLLSTSILTWLVGIAGICLCIFTVFTAYQLSEQIGTEKTRVSYLKQKLDSKKLAEKTPKKSTISETQANTINSAIRQLNLPWLELLDAMEAGTPQTIAILSLEPDAKKSVLKAAAEAKNTDDMIAYIEKLKRQPFFSYVALTRHEVNEQDANRPIRFQFEATWDQKD